MTHNNINPSDIDPVCRMKVGRNSRVPPFFFGDTTYYFCAPACRDAFVSDPGKYVGQNAPKKKGIWARYLERVNKATGGKPPCCH